MDEFLFLIKLQKIPACRTGKRGSVVKMDFSITVAYDRRKNQQWLFAGVCAFFLVIDWAATAMATRPRPIASVTPPG